MVMATEPTRGEPLKWTLMKENQDFYYLLGGIFAVWEYWNSTAQRSGQTCFPFANVSQWTFVIQGPVPWERCWIEVRTVTVCVNSLATISAHLIAA